MTRRLWGGYLLLAAGIAALSMSAIEAEPADLLQGQVLDERGEPVAGARIEMRSAAGPCFLVPEYAGRRWTTGADGRFEIPYPDKPMQMRIDHPSHATAWAPARDGIAVRLDQPAYVMCEVPGEASVRVRRGAELLAETSGSGALLLGPLPSYEQLTVSVAAPGIRPAQELVQLQPRETRRIAPMWNEGLAVTGRLSEPVDGVMIRASQGDGRDCVVRAAADGAFAVRGLREGAVRLIVLVPDRPVQMVDATAGDAIDVEVAR